ncbi:MAG: MBL fold metallo-hydrolase [Sandaracinaceae bacterium]
MTRDGRSEVFFSPFATGRWVGPAGEHFDGTRFRNQVDAAHESLGGVMKWMLNREPGRWQQIHATPGPKPPLRVRDGLRVTFVNHATFLLQLGGLNVLTDPVWGERTSPVGFAGPKRFRPPGIRFEDLPPIDLVLLSHDHFDHLCEETTRRLAEAHAPAYATGLGNAALLRRFGVDEVHELDWWDGAEIGGAKVTFTPAQHFSGRGLGDRDRTLWGAFALEHADTQIYFAGDTGMGPHFAQTRERLGAPDLALLPIGAYRPQWFMSRVHVSPAEAVEAARILEARVSVATHFGTFKLADDGMREPVEDLKKALCALGDDAPAFWVLEEGSARVVPGREAAARVDVRTRD